ncbi:glycyl radical protein [Chloroflexota bacterium]
MAVSMLEQIDEVNKVIALTDRVKKRLEESRAATPHIDAERSRLVTESWKETEGEPLDIRRAKLFKKIMEGISVHIEEGELIVGFQTKYIRGASPTVEWDADFTLSMFKTDKPSFGLVKVAEVSEEEKASLLEDAHYWEGKGGVDRIRHVMRGVFGNYIDELAAERFIFEPSERQSGGQVLGYGKVIDEGLNSIIAEAKDKLEQLSAIDFSDRDAINKLLFWQAVVTACEGAIKFANRYAEFAREQAGRESDTTRKKELEEIADICQWVPANPARTFREALQSFWFIQVSAALENNRNNEAPGRMDQYLYPLYKKDLEEGRLTRQEAAELLGLLWVKLVEREASRGPRGRAKTQGNLGQLVVIGGVKSDGSDASNELTYLLLEVARQVKTVQPPLYLRCHVGTPEELWMKAMEVLRDRGDGVPAFISDQATLLNFTAKGIPIQAARDYAVGGCVHPHVNYYSASGGATASINSAKILELTLNNGVDPKSGKLLGLATGDPRDFSSFDQLDDAYKRQFSFFVDFLGKYRRLYWYVRAMYYSLPFMSALLGDCIEKGLDLNRGGTRYPQLYFGYGERGHQNVANSLAAIKKLVFEEKKLTMDQLLQTLKANFEGDGNKDIQQMLLAAPKYGNDDDYVDDIFNDISLWQQYRLTEEKCPFGLPTRLSRGGATQHVYFGQAIGALPDGRKAWEPLADGTLSAMRFTDVKGPTAVVNSASKVNHTELCSSALFNMKFLPQVMQTIGGQQRLISLVKTYFDRGGYFIQFNVQGTEVLREAKNHPEQHRDLIVRVAGYSAYFVELTPELQDEIIARTEYTL